MWIFIFQLLVISCLVSRSAWEINSLNLFLTVWIFERSHISKIFCIKAICYRKYSRNKFRGSTLWSIYGAHIFVKRRRTQPRRWTNNYSLYNHLREFCVRNKLSVGEVYFLPSRCDPLGVLPSTCDPLGVYRRPLSTSMQQRYWCDGKIKSDY
jgi:hypothetical protein